jgi:hypothetical protein
MAQHPLIIGDVDGPTFRGELNDLFEALASKQSGSGEPANPRPFMWWADTTTGLLKIRNAANTDWITFGTLASVGLGLASVGANTFTGLQNLADNILQRPRLIDYGETVNPLGSISGARTINLEAGNVATGTVADDVTFTFSGVGAGVAHFLTLGLTNGGAHSVTWPAAVRWRGGIAPALAADGIDWLNFLTVDGGVTWYGTYGVQRVPVGFAKVLSVTPTSIASANTSHPVDMPATVIAGELLLYLCSSDFGTAAINTPAGLKKNAHGVFVKKAVGDEGGGTQTFGTTTSTRFAAQVYRISDWSGNLSDVVVSQTSGLSAFPNPPNVTAPWGAARNLYIAATMCNDDAESATDEPAGYSELLNTVADAGVNNSCSVSSARRELEAASDNPGSFVLTGSEAWSAESIVIRPIAG